MKGDFSRSSFNAEKHYRGVRLQQGRVQLDADWNEQVDIQLHQRERELRDLLGDHGAPQASLGFTITLPAAPPTADPPGQLLPPDVQIAQGQRYVDGILCVNETDHSFTHQPDLPGAERHRLAAKGEQQLVYLDVWQHHVTVREDAELREVALDGLDTTTRLQTVAQVKFWSLPAPAQPGETPTLATAFRKFLAEKQPAKGTLAAQKTGKGVIPQNQLYRVEIHSIETDQVCFKWSRENGAVAYSIQKIEPNANNSKQVDVYLQDVKLEQLDLQNKDWVELTSNHDALDGKAGLFGAVMDIQPDIQRITVQPALNEQLPIQTILSDEATCQARCMVLQRWDQKESKEQPLCHGAVTVKFAVPEKFDGWMTLENGVQVKFTPGTYVVGDYWLIPARTTLKKSTGDILWPKDQSDPPVAKSEPPAGIAHHYAPLALLQYQESVWHMVGQDESAPPTSFRTLPILTQEVDKLTCRVDKAEAEIVKLQGKVEALTTRVTLLEQRMDKVEAQLDALKHLQLYQDFKSDEDLQVGTVVAYSSTNPGYVEKVTLTNATLLLGVVVNDHRKPTYRVAMQGLAKCKVIGAVKPGALMIPSRQAGYVEQAGLYLQPGTVLGKVLIVPDQYSSGTTDLVDVLITLN